MNINRDEWLRALTEAQLSPIDDQDAVTVPEFMALFSLTRSTADRRLRTLVEKGKATKTSKFTNGIDGRRVQAVAFRLNP